MSQSNAGAARVSLRFSQAIVGVGSSLIVGLLVAVVTISTAAIAYSGDLEAFAGAGAITALLGTGVGAVIGAVTLSNPGTLCGSQNITAVALSVAAAGVLAAAGAGEAVFPTIATMMTLSTALTGFFFIVLGAFKAGALARYVPYPVVGGFLAATGVLLVLAAFAISTSQSVSIFDLPSVVAGSDPIRWGPAIALAIVLFVLGRLTAHPAVLTTALGLALAAFYAVLGLTGTSLDEARALGLLLGAPAGPSTYAIMDLTVPAIAAKADWAAIAASLPKLLIVSGLAAVGMVMSATGLEHTTAKEVDVDREFVGTGLANLGSAAVGGLPVYHYFGATTLAHTLHLRSAVAGCAAAAVCLALVLFGSAVVENLPVAVLAGLTGFIGLNLVYDWLVTKRTSLPPLDYGVVLLIVGVMVGVGFLEGVAVGLISCVAVFVVLSGRQDVVLKSFSSATQRSMVDRGPDALKALQMLGHKTMMFELNGHLFFGTANRLYQEVAGWLAHDPLETVVLDFRRVQSIDSSAAYSFEKLVTRCKQNGTMVVVTGLPERLRQATGLQRALATGAAIEFAELDEGMEWAEEQLLAHMSGDDEKPANWALLDAFRTTAGRYATRRTLAPGDVLVASGEGSDGYFMLLDGQLSVRVPGAAGAAFRIRSVGPGALVGEVGHYTGQARTATVVAVRDSTVLHVGEAALAEMEREAPEAASQLHRLAAQYLAMRLTENTHLLQRAR